MRTFAALILCLSVIPASSWATPRDGASSRCAILLHGLARTSAAMSKLEEALSAKGFLVRNQTYPSTTAPIGELAVAVEQGLHFCESQGATEIFIVTHSLGGILVRFFFQDRDVPTVKGIVMLAPPNHGSEVVDHLREFSWFGKAMGPASLELGTEAASVPNRLLRPLRIPVGIIAGTESSDPWFAHFFTGPNDGKVSVESAKLPEMADFRTIPAGHTFMPRSDEAIEQTLTFFEKLRFR
ncbi:MAG: hypothetical protein KF789_12540 [Bdellovibrionaceae bacterium]|nr:hypothetical protein [Pseudobdellovibrionaceae bacterium]